MDTPIDRSIVVTRVDIIRPSSTVLRSISRAGIAAEGIADDGTRRRISAGEVARCVLVISPITQCWCSSKPRIASSCGCSSAAFQVPSIAGGGDPVEEGLAPDVGEVRISVSVRGGLVPLGTKWPSGSETYMPLALIVAGSLYGGGRLEDMLAGEDEVMLWRLLDAELGVALVNVPRVAIVPTAGSE